MASLYIKDGDVDKMARTLAERRQVTKTEAVRQTLAHELLRDAPGLTAREKLEAFHARNPLLPPTGLKADKAFFRRDVGGGLTIFLDASAIVAMISDEPEKHELLTAIEGERDLLWSPMSCWETVSALNLANKAKLLYNGDDFSHTDLA